MTKVGIKVTIDKVGQIGKGLRLLASSRVLVGVPAEHAIRGGEPINNAAIGFINEFGAPEANIPARPHLVPGVRAVRDDVAQRFRDAGKAALEGKPDVVERNLHAAGLIAQRSVRRKITTGPFAPLALSTLYKRKHRKVAPRKGEKPLLDTGQYRNSITYVVRGGVR